MSAWPTGPWWRRLSSRAPRRLRLTRAGTFVTGVALALGLAAINTGNNPLFFLWGVLLGSIVVSGILSEATLRPLVLDLQLPPAMRSGEASQLVLRARNCSRVWPAMAVRWSLRLVDQRGEQAMGAGFVLRLGPGENKRLWVPFTPRCRGVVEATMVLAETAYPFGFFVKERPYRLSLRPGMARPARAVVPAAMAARFWQARGARQSLAEGGDDFRALRTFAPGDALRRVLWRRVASTGRWLVMQRESERADAVILLVRCHGGPAANEDQLARAGSVAEALLAEGLAVGLWTHGTALAAQSGPEQAGTVLDALARVEASMPLPMTAPSGGAVVVLEELLGARESAP